MANEQSEKSNFDEAGLTPARLSEILLQFRKDSEALDGRMEALTRKYPKQWVGMQNGRLVRAASQPLLLAKLRDAPNAAVRYLNPNPPTIVLTCFEGETLH